MKNELLLKISGVSIIAILLIATMVTTLITTGKPTPCPTCGGSPEIESKEILKGEKRERAIRIAVNSKVFKDVLPSLIERGFRPSIKDAVAVLVKFKQSGKCIRIRWALGVMVPFKHQNDKLKGLIAFVWLKNLKSAVAIVLDLKEKKSDIVGKSITIERRNRAPTTMYTGGECETDEDCIEKYGLGWRCEKECVDWDWDALNHCLLGCTEIYHVQMELCAELGEPEAVLACMAICTAWYIACVGNCYNTHCIEWEGRCVRMPGW